MYSWFTINIFNARHPVCLCHSFFVGVLTAISAFTARQSKIKSAIRGYSWYAILWAVAFAPQNILAQQKINRSQFFASAGTCSLQISAPFKTLQQYANPDVVLPAEITLQDSLQGTWGGNVQIGVRGKSRLAYCENPPLMLYFKKSKNLAPLDKVKMAWSCKSGPLYDQLIIKEYLAYQLYQVVSPYSLQTRLAEVQYREKGKNNRWNSGKAILLEDIDDAAKRLGAKELNDTTLPAAALNPDSYTLLTVFQYMIGNTDWSIKGLQNIKLLQPSNKRLPPIPVPYDFDNSGLVSAYYAAPHASIPVSEVWQRFFKGIKRPIEEIEPILKQFRKKKMELLQVIAGCKELEARDKKELTDYLISFFSIIENEKKVIDIFTPLPVSN